MAVRVCTDCHFSLQTVTVASAAALEAGGGAEEASAATESHPALRDGGLSPGVSSSGGGSGGRPLRERGAGAEGGVVEVVQDVLFGGDFSGHFGGPGFHGRGQAVGFAEEVDAEYSSVAREIHGDVVLADVLEWGRIEVSAVYWCGKRWHKSEPVFLFDEHD